MVGAPAAASRAIRTAWTLIPAVRVRGLPWRPRRICARGLWAPKPMVRSSARPATTSWSGSSRRLGCCRSDGIIPIAHSQDTAGPMCRTVTDAAIMLGAMQSPVRHRSPAIMCRATTGSSCSAVHSPASASASTGATSLPDYGGEPDLVAVAQQGIDAMAEPRGDDLVAGRYWRCVRVLRRGIHGAALRVQGADRRISGRSGEHLDADARGPDRLQHRTLRGRDDGTSARSSSSSPRRRAAI